MRILHYICVYAPAWKYGGPVLSVSSLCEELARFGHDVEVFTTNAGLEHEPGIRPGQVMHRNGVRVCYFQRTPGLGIRSPAMQQAVRARAREFDVVHVTGVWQRTSPAACKAARRSGVPYVISTRGALGPYSWGQKTLKKAVYFCLKEWNNLRGAAGLHYTSQWEMERCKWLRLPGHSFVIANGMDTSKWAPDPVQAAAWRRENGIPAAALLLLSVGRLHHVKGLELIPEILNRIGREGWRMVFVGGDEDGTKRRLMKLFEESKLTSFVQWHESKAPEELCRIYSASDLFLLPSRHESFGNVIIEALACGTPVLVSDEVGISRDVAAAAVGWSFPRQAQLWSQFIVEVLRDREKLRLTAGRARRWVEANFNVETTARQMEAEYKNLLSQTCSLLAG